MTSFNRTVLAIASLGALLLAGCAGPTASGLVPQSSSVGQAHAAHPANEVGTQTSN